MLLHACRANPHGTHLLLLCRSFHTLATISMNCIFHFLSDVVLLERRATVFLFSLVFSFPHFPKPPFFQEVWVSGGGGALLPHFFSQNCLFHIFKPHIFPNPSFS